MCKRVQTRVYVGPVKFFRNQLLVLDSDGISSLVDTMEKEVTVIRKEVIKFCWFMRGGATYDEVMHMSQGEREIINQIITENLETTKKSGLPFF